MLVTLKDVLDMAEKEKYAIGAFNTPNLECIMAVIHSAEHFNVPVVISHAELHEPVMQLSVIGPIMVQMAKRAKVPVCVHLDHGETLAYLKQALDLGFTSIMYDGSMLPYEENLHNTREAILLARKTGASVEAELGTLGRSEAGGEERAEDKADVYTDPELAKKFVEESGIDALAVSFGTVHGLYTTQPNLDFVRIETIRSLVHMPLVMHGGSGVSPEDYTTAIRKGIRKINYYTYMSQQGVLAVEKLLCERKVTFFHDIAKTAVRAMEEDVKNAMSVFYRKIRV